MQWVIGSVAALISGAAMGQVTLWDTGAPHVVNFNGADTNLGYSSGTLAGAPQRWAAVPFAVGAGGVLINEVRADWFIVAGSEGATVNYVIWDRSGLTAPTVAVSSGVLGAYGVGIDDPRNGAVVDDWLHIYTGLSIALGAGDYYFTLYSDGFAPGNNSGTSNAAWLTGGDLQDEALEQDHMWRSVAQPAPGFAVYAPGNVLPGAGMADGQDRWNPCFSLHGERVPAPGTLGLALAGLVVAGRRRR
jgi:uncharacterized protein (TIGR03382 family)